MIGATISHYRIIEKSEGVQEEANVILNAAKRSEESDNLNQILRPTWETVGLRMTFGTASGCSFRFGNGTWRRRDVPNFPANAFCERSKI